MKTMRNLKGNKGFSLIELMVVVAIMGALAAIALPMYNKYRAKTLQERAVNEARGFMNAFRAAYAASETKFRIAGVQSSEADGAFVVLGADKTRYGVRTYKDAEFTYNCNWFISPVIANGEPTFYVGSGQGLAAISANTGNIRQSCIDLVTGQTSADNRNIGQANTALRQMLFEGKIGNN